MFVFLPPETAKSFGALVALWSLVFVVIVLPLSGLWLLTEQTGGGWFVAAVVAGCLVVMPRIPKMVRPVAMLMVVMFGVLGLRAQSEAKESAVFDRVAKRESAMRDRAAAADGGRTDFFLERPADATMNAYARLVADAVGKATGTKDREDVLLAKLACRNLTVLDFAAADLIRQYRFRMDESVWEGWATPEFVRAIRDNRGKLVHAPALMAAVG